MEEAGGDGVTQGGSDGRRQLWNSGCILSTEQRDLLIDRISRKQGIANLQK